MATHDGKAVTACGMVHVGEYTPVAFAQAGIQYRQAVTVFLPPQAPDRARDDSAAR